MPGQDRQAPVVTSVWGADGRDVAGVLSAAASLNLEAGEPVFIDDLGTLGLRSAVAIPVVHGSDFMGAALLAWRESRQPDPDLLAVLATLGTQIGQFVARKQAENEADRLKDEFFALVSHELRTPLTSIIGYVELALEEDGLDDEARRFLEVVQRNAARLLRLVGDLLFVALVEAGKLSLDPGPVDMLAVCSESVETARPRAEAGQVDLLLDAGRVPSFTGDAGRLGQAIDNLVSNALKFTPAGGTVTVALRQVRDQLVVDVSDTGVGVPDDEQSRLFDRFFRSQSAHEQAVPGVGLGLTIAKAIVDGHHGWIRVRSEEGRGTTFSITLPLTSADDLSRSAPRPMEVPR
jgi:signal transduction histidine kinase